MAEFVGRITMLRAHDFRSKFGPSDDEMDVEVVFALDSQPGKVFGFTLRDDSNKVAHPAMLDLLRDAMADPRLRVRTNVDVQPKQDGTPRKHNRAFTVEITR